MNWEVDVPDITEQKRIGGILKSIDDKILLNNRINHNLEEQAKHHFEEWCRGCNEEKSISELSVNILDYSQNQRDKVILLNSSDVTEGRFATLPYVENLNLKGQFKKRFRKGDILYSEIRPRNHHYAICYFDAEDYIASTRLMIIRRNPELVSSDALLYQYLLMRRVEEEFTSKTESRSGTFPQGNYEDLSSSIVPYSRENQFISKTLDALYSIIWLNMEESRRLASFRDALLPLLFSGDLTC
jgi:type I restriction enzyme S subunit